MLSYSGLSGVLLSESGLTDLPGIAPWRASAVLPGLAFALLAFLVLLDSEQTWFLGIFVPDLVQSFAVPRSCVADPVANFTFLVLVFLSSVS